MEMLVSIIVLVLVSALVLYFLDKLSIDQNLKDILRNIFIVLVIIALLYSVFTIWYPPIVNWHWRRS